MKKGKKAAAANLTGEEKRVARLRANGLSYREIEEKVGHPGNGSWALRVARRAGVA